MSRWFNTAGPCKPDDHYMLPTLRRLPSVHQVIDQQGYFVLHAPRQVGKTTSLVSLGRELTGAGKYAAVLVSMEVGQPFREVGAAELPILHSWRAAIEHNLPRELWPPPWPEAPPGERIGAALRVWARTCPRPLVVFLDEIDALRDDVLISVLRQLRSGFDNRPKDFPWSLALCGLRDVRDYKLAEGYQGRLGTASPFNIKVESFTMKNFTQEEVAELYAQHTAETGQAFLPETLEAAFRDTQGQPWLVNALARQLVQVVAPDGRPVTLADEEEARRLLIRRMDTHLDSLADKLREPRVRRIIEPMLLGDALSNVPESDLRYLMDLGLLRMDPQGGLVVANPIYAEVIVRHLALGVQASLPQIPATWLSPAGRLDAARLLDAFLAFWREHGEALLGASPYPEAAPHLVLMAFLHRVENGGGTVTREYAVSRGRLDLCLRYGPDRVAMELKVWRGGRKNPVPGGLQQLDRYLQGLGLQEGWLVVFDQRPGLAPIEERTRTEEVTSPAGRRVTLLWA